MMPEPHEAFICEELTPEPGSFDASNMARGLPGLPARFTWRGTEYRIAGVIKQWKSTGPCHSSSGSSEMYLRRHWFQVLTEPAATMTLYCDRQAKNRKNPKSRWYVYSAAMGEDD